MSLFTRITLPLAAINFINQANRSLVAVIGPFLALEFGLTAAELGLLAACFFASYAMAQLPIGLALDLKGPRRVQATLALIAAAGFTISALSADVLMLAAGRCVAGVGVAAGLMAMLKANTQWYPKERVAAVTGAGLFFASMGGLAATMPVQWALPFIGWRGVFAVLALLAIMVSAWIWFSVPNAPPGVAPAPRRSLSQEIAEYGRIFKDPVFLRLVPTVGMLSTLNFTFQGLWAGPWLRDVGGLDDGARAAALLIYALGMMFGSLFTGQAASFAQARGYSPMLMPYIGVAGCLFAQAMLMLGPSNFWIMAFLWFFFCFSGSVGPAGYAAIAQGFPPALAGRVSTAINFLMLCVVFVFQTGIGAILDLWPRNATGGWAPEGYVWALGMTFSIQLAAALDFHALVASTKGTRVMEKRVTKILDRYRVTKGRGFRLKDYDPGDTAGLEMQKTAAEALLQQGIARLAEMQDKLYAQDRWSVLCIFQAMDAAGKDGAIKHVFSGVNPQGCQVHSFKAPGAMELDHDFLWRHSVALPERGRIGIHNRSWYEEVLVLRVHPEFLARQRLPPSLIGKKIWDERLEDIAAYERYLARQGTVVLKFFLNVSREEQKKRFLARIDEPEKNWKFSPNDVAERAHWDDYMKAYQAAISTTAAPHAPWFVVPADAKWFTRLVVGAAIIEALEKLDLHYPAVTKEQRTALAVAKKSLG